MSDLLDQKLAALKLGRMRQVYASWIEQAVQSELGYAEFLEQLVSEELLARQENHLRRKMKAAGFPYAHGLRNEMQKKKKRALQTGLILWLVRRPGRSIFPESKDEIQQDGQDSKQHDQENRDEAHKRGIGNDDNHQHKHKD